MRNYSNKKLQFSASDIIEWPERYNLKLIKYSETAEMGFHYFPELC